MKYELIIYNWSRRKLSDKSHIRYLFCCLNNLFSCKVIVYIFKTNQIYFGAIEFYKSILL